MRPRKMKHGDLRFNACRDFAVEYNKEEPEYIVTDSAFLSRRLEVGCGKGAFITTIAEKEPGVMFYAVEKMRDVMVYAMEKAAEKQLANVKFLDCNAELLNKLFAPSSFETVYLNFSDPWPKVRHAKRRLVYRGFLLLFKSLLCDGGSIYFKTDNEMLFDYSFEEFDAAGFEVCEVTRDLHSSEYAADNIMTEYEKNFSKKGQKIFCLRATKRDNGDK